MERRQQAKGSYNVDEVLDFLFDSDDEDQGNILDYTTIRRNSWRTNTLTSGQAKT